MSLPIMLEAFWLVARLAIKRWVPPTVAGWSPPQAPAIVTAGARAASDEPHHADRREDDQDLGTSEQEGHTRTHEHGGGETAGKPD